MEVLVAGGTGFVGRRLCRVLDDRGHSVTAASRSPDSAAVPDGVAIAPLDVTSDDPTDVVAGHDAVVNLVALPSHLNRPGRSHEAVSLGGARALVDASEATGVDRFVQLSAIGAGRGIDAAYFRAKDRVEALVRDADLESVIVRPSVVFGDGAGFLRFLHRVTPPYVVPLPAAETLRMEPIWVGDLAPMLADGVTEDRHAGATYELDGPDVLTLADVVRLVCDDPLIVPIPDPVTRVGFEIAERVPGVPFGTDQYRLLQQDNTTDDGDLDAFGVEPADLTTLEAYLRAEPES